jgi:hypothetical protein
MISKHNRRDGYWKYYHLAHTQERDFLVNHIVNEKSSPNSTKEEQEWKVHSKAKIYCICIVMVVFGWTYRDTENNIPSLNLPWSEPVPDYTTIA